MYPNVENVTLTPVVVPLNAVVENVGLYAKALAVRFTVPHDTVTVPDTFGSK